MSQDFAAQLSHERAATLRPLNAMTLKGKSLPIEVFSLNDETQIFEPVHRNADIRLERPRQVSVLLVFGATRRIAEEGARISVGRGSENDIVVPRSWVSRRHATVAVTGNRVQLTDRSSYGSYLTIAHAPELLVRRETVILSGAGRFSPGTSMDNSDAAVVEFEVSVD